MGFPAQIAGIKGGLGSYLRRTLGTNLAETRSLLRAGYRAGGGFGGMARAGKAWLGFGFDPSSMRGLFDQGVGLGSLGKKIARVGGPTGALSYQEAASNIFRARRVAAGVGLGAAAIATSAVTGMGVVDQAQAVAGGTFGYRGARALNRGKFGTAAMTLAAAYGGQAMGGQGWMMGGLGYGGIRAAQALSGRKLGGMYGRAAGALTGAAIGSLL